MLVKTKELSQALSFLVQVTPTSTVIPQLNNIMAECRKDRNGNDILMLTTSDGDVWLSVKVHVEQSNEGDRISVNASDFSRIIKTIESESVNIVVTDDNKSVIVSYGSGKTMIPIEDTENYPLPMSADEDRKHRIIDGKYLSDGLSKTLATVANDELRPIMNGIHIELRQDSMVLASSDFNRLSKFTCCEVTSSEDKTSAFNVPRKSASILLSLLNRYEGKVKITDASGVVIFNNTEFMLTTRLIEGRYPNFESVIPKNSCTEAIVSRDSMIRTLKRMSMLMAGYNLMTVSVNGGDNGTIKIASDDSINGKMSEESVSAEITGDNLSIGFNIKSFLECIQEVGTENVIIRFTSPTTPATVQPMNDDTYLYVLMPLLVS